MTEFFLATRRTAAENCSWERTHLACRELETLSPALRDAPRDSALSAWLDGAAFGMIGIGWIVVAAMFLYTMTLITGRFEIVKESITRLSGDRRIQALLIAFSFGAFIEGAAGFGTPVAIAGAMLIGIGFKPLQAAGLALIGNTAPVAFGALGTPLITLYKITGLPLAQLSS